jgi:hypothetical protein
VSPGGGKVAVGTALAKLPKETRRMVVVGPCLLGVRGAIPKLRRALTGAGTPGRKVCPGSGAVPRVGLRLAATTAGSVVSNVKWSVWRSSRDGGGRAWYGVEFFKSSSVAAEGGGSGNEERSLEEILEEAVSPQVEVEPPVAWRLSPKEEASALIDELTVVAVQRSSKRQRDTRAR